MINSKFFRWFQIKDHSYGESYLSILKYFYPECITALILYSLPYFVDSYFIGSLKFKNTFTIVIILSNPSVNLFISNNDLGHSKD